MMSNKKKKIALAVSLSLLAILIIISITLGVCWGRKPKKPPQEKKETPLDFPKYNKPDKKVVDNADYYVSVNEGNDTNDGSKVQPFKTIKRAHEAVRKIIRENPDSITKDITIAVMGGEYNIKQPLSFGEKDVLPNGHRVVYTSYNSKEVVFDGSLNLKGSDFQDISAEDAARLSENARNHVRVVNLFSLGVTPEEIDKLYAIGGFSQGRKYGEKWGHPEALEVFYEDQRMELARYPNKGYSKIGSIVDYGEASEHVKDIIDWNAIEHPRPPKFLVDDEMKAHMQNWKKPTSDLNSIWSYGYYYWDWADASTPVADFDSTKGQLDVKYSSPYGIREGQNHYVYNVFEELDGEGEYYLDRVTGNLYVYFPDTKKKDAKVSVSLLKKSIINANEKSKNLTFDGMTIKHTRGNGIEIKGSNIVISNMHVKNVSSNGIRVEGQNNIVKDNEIENIGKSGIVAGHELKYVEGNVTNDIRFNGLRMENNNIKNNYIHAYGVIQKTYSAGIFLQGVGNKAQHNEIFDAPHMGIYYAGNEHIIEYNYIHHAVKESSDAGAIYSGRNLSYFGNVVRYNAVTDIGSGQFTPNGIYFDDCLAGQVAYGNLLANIPGSGFLVGGGREHKIYDNVIVNAKTSIEYDSRAYDGIDGGWYKNNVNTPSSRQWKLMTDAQQLYANWLKDPQSVEIMKRSEAEYSNIMKMVGFDKKKDANSAATPNGSVYGNIVVSRDGIIGKISDVVKENGRIENNKIYRISEDKVAASFTDLAKGRYAIKKDSLIAKENKNYNLVPYNKIGRVNEED